MATENICSALNQNSSYELLVEQYIIRDHLYSIQE